MKDLLEQRIVDILLNVYDMNFLKPCLNERYLHHHFTEKIQIEYPIVYNNLDKCKLHPEWATANKFRLNGGGKYKKIGNKYEIDDNGTSGFIDFALGDYNNPEIVIEFKCNKSWQFQSIVFDYMKLMDKNNPLKKVVSISIIYRDKKLSNKLTLNKINESITELSNRLNGRMDINRPFLFWIIEIAYNNKQKESWYCRNLNEKFVNGIPQ